MSLSMRSIATLFTSALVLGTTASTASAAQLFANKVEFYNNNGTPMAAYRTNTINALGAPQAGNTQDFLALGLGGEAIFSFGAAISGNITLWETTWGFYSNQAGYDEQVEVYVGNDLKEWFYVDLVKNIEDGAFYGKSTPNTYLGATVSTTPLYGNKAFNYVRLVDKSQKGSDRDGFDVNAIAADAADVPEPATMLGVLIAAGVATRLKRQHA